MKIKITGLQAIVAHEECDTELASQLDRMAEENAAAMPMRKANTRFKRKTAAERMENKREYRENRSEKRSYNRSHKNQIKRTAMRLKRWKKAHKSAKPLKKKGFTRVN